MVLPGDGKSDSPQTPTRSTESRGSLVIVVNRVYEANNVVAISDSRVIITARIRTVSDGGERPNSCITFES